MNQNTRIAAFAVGHAGRHANNDILFDADERSKSAAGTELPVVARLAEYVTVEELTRQYEKLMQHENSHPQPQ